MRHSLSGNIINWEGWFLRSGIALNPGTIVKSCPLEFWFDGADPSTFTLNVNRVIQWRDKSVNLRHVNNAIDVRRPTYNPVTGRVTFTAALQTYLQCTAAAFGVAMVQPNTIYVLYKLTGNLVANRVNFDSAAGAQRNYFAIFGGNFYIGSNLNIIDGATNALDNIHIGEFNGLISNYWINGANVAAGNAGNVSLDGIVLGSIFNLTQFNDLEFMEACGWNCLLTNQEHYNMHNYFVNKWGLPWPNPW